MNEAELRAQLASARARAKAAEAKLAEWQQAFGLLTTLAPDLEIDATDPLGMARTIERHVLAVVERARDSAMEQQEAVQP